MRSAERDTRSPRAAEIVDLYERLQRSKAKIIGRDGRSQPLPDSLYKFLNQVMADLAEGNSFSIVQKDATVTTIEAAHMLGVSRQFVVKLLERGDLPHFKVGTHRRVYARDLLAYKARRDGNRRAALNDLARQEAAEGVYDMPPLMDDQLEP